jgi:hypothetical protein
MNDNDFDKFLSQTFKAGEIKVDTSIEQIEQLITDKYNRRVYNQKKHKIRIVLAVIALLAIGGLMIAPPSAYALREKMMNTILSWGRYIHIQISTSSNSSPKLISKIETGVAALQPEVPFTILAPTYIPPGFQFESVKKIPQDEQAKIIFTFVAKDSSVILTQTKVSSNTKTTINTNAKESKVENIQVGRSEGVLITFKNGYCSLIWITENNIECKLFGKLSPEQAREMAISMQ